MSNVQCSRPINFFLEPWILPPSAAMNTNNLNMEAIYTGGFYTDLIQYLIKCKYYVAQNDSPTTVYQASTFAYFERLVERRVLQRFRTCDSVKQTNLFQLRIASYCDTCPRKVGRSNASDWSIFHLRPEQDHLVRDQYKIRGLHNA